MSGPGQLNTMSVKLIQFVGDEAAHKAADLFSASHTTFWVFALLNIRRV